MSLARFTAKSLDRSEVQQLIDKTVNELSVLSGLEEIILFGSAARNKMTDGSDLDLVLIFSTEDQVLSARRQLYGLRKPPLVPCDLILVDRSLFDARAAIGGVLMVAKDEGRTVFKARGECNGAAKQTL